MRESPPLAAAPATERSERVGEEAEESRLSDLSTYAPVFLLLRLWLLMNSAAVCSRSPVSVTGIYVRLCVTWSSRQVTSLKIITQAPSCVGCAKLTSRDAYFLLNMCAIFCLRGVHVAVINTNVPAVPDVRHFDFFDKVTHGSCMYKLANNGVYRVIF